MSKKWLWLTIVGVAASFLIVATVARRSEPKQSEVAVSPRQAPAPAPLTFRERKAQGLLTPDEQARVEEIAQMRAEAEKYNREREVRIARGRAEKTAASKQAAEVRQLRERSKQSLAQQRYTRDSMVPMDPGPYEPWSQARQDEVVKAFNRDLQEQARQYQARYHAQQRYTQDEEAGYQELLRQGYSPGTANRCLDAYRRGSSGLPY